MNRPWIPALIIAVFLIVPSALAQDPDNLVTDEPEDFVPCVADCPGPPPAPPGSTQVNNHTIEQFLVDEYLARWGLVVPKPAYIFTKNVLYDQGRNSWTSVAYIDNHRYRLYVQPDGTVSAWDLPLSQTPSGVQKTLTVVVDHHNTNIADLMDTWLVDAQNAINEDHWEQAAGLGLAEPIVRFDLVNLLVSANEFADPLQGPKTPARVYEVLLARGIVLEDWDLILVMDLDSDNTAGGFAFFGGTWGYIGYTFLSEPGFVELTQDMLRLLTRALYHHEVGHAWGWEHEWDSGSFTYRGPLIVNPRLFGMTDTDGDGVPEVIDDTPYGAP